MSFWSWIRALLRMRTSVGFLCSTTQAEMAHLLQDFKDGLNDHRKTVVPRFAGGNYRHGTNINDLMRDARQLMTGRNHVDVMVTTGGVISLAAATEVATAENITDIPILFIVGRSMDNLFNHPNISGGIDLDLSRHNGQRVTRLRNNYLGGAQVPVGLLVNHNSAIGPMEADEWVQNGWGPIQPPIGSPLNNNQIRLQLQNLVDQLVTDGARAIVVSGDAFFGSTVRDRLVDILNNKHTPANDPIPVCYPFDTFMGRAAGGKSMRYGAELRPNYQELGRKAKQVFASRAIIPNVGITTVIPTEYRKP
jgi:hypothetical protein